MTYHYDTNPVDATRSQYAQGRLAAIQYGSNGPWEMFSYHPAGAVVKKSVYVQNVPDPGGSYSRDLALDANYTLDSAGRPVQMSYPGFNSADNLLNINYNYTYDSNGRLYSLAQDASSACGNMLPSICQPPPNTQWVKSAQYNISGQLTSMQTPTAISDGNGGYVWETESRGYNVSGQLTSIDWNTPAVNYPYYAGSDSTITYNYSATNNNGQITSMGDTRSGETVTYQYDLLRRLISATAAATSTGTQHWTQSYTFDGFGNLTAKNTNGVVTSYPVDAATNRIWNGNAGSAGMYDASGNMTGAPGAILQYDSMNRVFTANVNGAMEYYLNGSNNRRIMTTRSNGSVDYTLYGTKGERLGVYRLGADQRSGNLAQFVTRSTEAWFGGRRMSGPRHLDRLGTSGTGYYPFGEARSTDTAMFATYETDGFTGLNDAVNRWYPAGTGRFASADPYQASAKTADPGTWNRFSYVGGDPANRRDANGLCYSDKQGNLSDDDNPGSCYDGADGAASADDSDYYGGADAGNNSVTVTSDSGPDQIPVSTVSVDAADAPAAQTETGNASDQNDQILPCFVKGAVVGVVGAVAIGAVATLAAPIIGATAVTGALLVGGAAGVGFFAIDVYGNYINGNTAGLAYDAGSFFGGVVGGAFTGNGTASGIKSPASKGWSFNRDIANRWTSKKGWNPLPWLGTGPDGGAAAGAQAGAAQGIPRRGC